VKTALAAELYPRIVKTSLGNVFVDSTRIVSPAAGLSAEPDIVVVLWQSLQEGRVREVPAASGEPGRFVELEGASDLIVEIVSDRSVRKDLERLPQLLRRSGDSGALDGRRPGRGSPLRDPGARPSRIRGPGGGGRRLDPVPSARPAVPAPAGPDGERPLGVRPPDRVRSGVRLNLLLAGRLRYPEEFGRNLCLSR